VQTSTAQTRGALTATESAVLGLLTRGARSGYELHKLAERSVGHVWAPAKSQIYAVLPRLVAGGYATRRDVRQRRRPDKQVYRITSKGERALREWLADPPRSSEEFLLKVFFGGFMEQEALVRLLESRRAEARAELAAYRDLEEEIRDREESYFGHLTLRWGLAYARALARWCDDVLAELARRGDGG
jgi:PadR family transcriptional regulator AphA